MLFGQDIKVTKALAQNVGAGATVNGATLDMANFEGCAVILSVAATDGTGNGSLKVQESDDGSTWSDLAGTAITVTTTAGQVYISDLKNVLKRYIRVVFTAPSGGTAGSDVVALYCQYLPRKKAVSQPSGTTLETHVAPVAGTA